MNLSQCLHCYFKHEAGTILEKLCAIEIGQKELPRERLAGKVTYNAIQVAAR